MYKYQIFFVSGQSLQCDEEDIAVLMDEKITSPYKAFRNDQGKLTLYINMTKVSHIMPIEIAQENDAVVTPKTPNDIKREKQEELDKSLSSVDNIVEKNKYALSKDEL